FAYEARRIYSTLTETTAQRETRRLVEWIRFRGGSVTAKELQRSNGRKYPTSADAEGALESLVAAGWGRWQGRPAGPKGGRPTRVFVLQEASDETDETDETPADEANATPAAPGETTEPSDETPQFSEKNGVSSVSSVVGHQESEPNRPPEPKEKSGEV